MTIGNSLNSRAELLLYAFAFDVALAESQLVFSALILIGIL